MKFAPFLLVCCVLLIPAVTSATVVLDGYNNEWCGLVNLYFSDSPSKVDGYKTLDYYAINNMSHDENVTVTAGQAPQLIDSYLSPVNATDGIMLLGGLRQYNIYGYVSSLSQPSYFTFNASIYHSDGTYTNLYNTTSIAISSTTATVDKTYYVSFGNFTFANGDRILIQLYGYTTRTSPTTIHFINGGGMQNQISYLQTGYYACPITAYISPTGGSESYAYDPTNSTPISMWILLVIGTIALLICAFKLRNRNEYGEVNDRKIIFSLLSVLACAFTAFCSLEISIPDEGLASSLIYQAWPIAVIFALLGVVSFAYFIYLMVLPEITDPDENDYHRGDLE